jgi:trk system potassium uptake protein TrkH
VHLLSIQRLLGLLLMLFSVTLLPPAAVSWLYSDGQMLVFLDGMLAALVLGCVAARKEIQA